MLVPVAETLALPLPPAVLLPEPDELDPAAPPVDVALPVMLPLALSVSEVVPVPAAPPLPVLLPPLPAVAPNVAMRLAWPFCVRVRFDVALPPAAGFDDDDAPPLPPIAD